MHFEVRQGLMLRKNGETCLTNFVVKCQKANQPSKEGTADGKEAAEPFRADVMVSRMIVTRHGFRMMPITCARKERMREKLA